MTLEIRTHRTRDELAPLAAEWDALVAGAARPSPFLLHAWCDEWLGLHDRVQLAVVSARRDGRLVGLLPACIGRRHGVRALTFIGDGESWLADLLLAPAEPGSTATAIVDELARAPYDVAALSGVSGGSLIEATARGRLTAIERVVSPVIDMPDGWEAAYALKTSSQRRARDRKRERQLEASPGFEQVIAETPDELEAVFDDVLALHRLRWAGKRDGSEFGTPAGARAQRAAVRRLAADGHAGVVLLRSEGRPVGFQLWLAVGDAMYLYRTGVDPSALKLSPGLIAMRRAIAHASDVRGVRRVEMLGAGEQYKLDLATRLLPTHDVYGLARTPIGAAAGASWVAGVRARKRIGRIELVRRVYEDGPRAALRRRTPGSP